MQENQYKKKMRMYSNRIKIEAGIRAGTIGLVTGLAGLVAVLWYGRLRYGTLILTEAELTAAALFLITTLLCYFFRLRPKKKEVLARIDSLGLQERIITMEELRDVDTVMAKRQRMDAMEHLEQLDGRDLKPRFYIKPVLWSLGLAIMAAVLLLWPFPKQEAGEQEILNEQEMEIVDEMISALKEILETAKINEINKSELNVIVEALAVSFTPEDSTLTRTAKIATASKRLDIMEAAKKSEITLKKQQATKTEASETEIELLEKEQKQLSATIKQMKDTMGTSIDILNKVEGTFWTPGGPSSGTSYEVTPLPFEEEPAEGEEPMDGMEPGEGEPLEGMEPGEGGETDDNAEGDLNGMGGQTIFDPEQGEVGYGSVYEEYYQEILKALTEQEFSGDIREIIEDYANSLE